MNRNEVAVNTKSRVARVALCARRGILHLLQTAKEYFSDFEAVEVGLPMVAAEGHEVRLAARVNTLQTTRHEASKNEHPPGALRMVVIQSPPVAKAATSGAPKPCFVPLTDMAGPPARPPI